jgi:hypothetical protein
VNYFFTTDEKNLKKHGNTIFILYIRLKEVTMEDVPIINAPICLRCMESIKSYGMLCAIVMEKICFNFCRGKVSIFEELDEKKLRPVIKFLEMKGFLVTTDVQEDIILVRPLILTTILTDEDWDLFCWCDS